MEIREESHGFHSGASTRSSERDCHFEWDFYFGQGQGFRFDWVFMQPLKPVLQNCINKKQNISQKKKKRIKRFVEEQNIKNEEGIKVRAVGFNSAKVQEGG